MGIDIATLVEQSIFRHPVYSLCLHFGADPETAHIITTERPRVVIPDADGSAEIIEIQKLSYADWNGKQRFVHAGYGSKSDVLVIREVAA